MSPMNAAGKAYWRSLEELAESPAFAAAIEREAPRLRDLVNAVDRRRFLQLMAASIALSGLTGCGPEANLRQLLPYVEQPEGIVPGRSRYYATATTLEGYASGVLIGHEMARPIKVEGNPDHPASLGAASAIMQASILSLYDPQRAQSIVGNGQIDTWQGFIAALHERRGELGKNHGEGLRLLTGATTSPSLVAQIADLQKQFAAMRWSQWEPFARDAQLAALQQYFGRPVEATFNLDQADIVLAVESDLISATPGWLAYARQFAARRRPTETNGAMSRVYAIESTPTLIGAKADHRLALRPAEIATALRIVAGTAGAGPEDWATIDAANADWFKAAAEDLVQHKGRALVHAGREQPAEIHQLVAAINGALGAFGGTIKAIEPVIASPTPHIQSFRELVDDMKTGRVDTLILLDTNPVYAAPADFEFADALAKVKFSASLSLYADETAHACLWRVPLAHEYEAWSDARAFDGTITIQQPQVRRLYGGHSAQEALAVLQGNTQPDDHALLRDFWRGQAQRENRGDFEQFWRESLRAGVVANSAAATVTAPPRLGSAGAISAVAPKAPEIDLLFRADESVWDGRFADNAWLLETPRAFTRLTWDNAALIAPQTAKRLDLADGDVIEIATRAGKLKAPAFVLPGQAPDCITLPLGFGRRAGGLGVGQGFDVYPLRRAATPWLTQAISVVKAGETVKLATVQGHDRVAGRDLIHEGALADFEKNPDFLRQKPTEESLYPGFAYPGRAWAMAIDLNSCIGCQACVVACQAENNVPTVGKELVLDQRIMHWLRIDRYYSGPADAPSTVFEPIPCMHCENAPCEVVCPVHATTHDHEGLNLMVYNRCVGTRFCSNNCPYKVRRFNFFAFADRTDRPPESWNPQVSVRGRGVMETCTYCIQRMRNAEIDADRDNRPLRDGEVVTACQQSCPTQAIVFGDRNDRASAVAKRKAAPTDYTLLEELNTRPRTSYAALIRNPNPRIASDKT